MKNAVSNGQTIDFTAGATITSGDGVLVGKILAVAADDVANGATGVGFVEGVFTMTVLGTDVVSQGDSLYWDDGNSRLTTTAAGSQWAGTAWGGSGNGVVTVDIKINSGNKDVVG